METSRITETLIHELTVAENRQICVDHYLLVLTDDGTLSSSVQPGQFINVMIPDRSDLTLRRPFSVARSKPNSKQVEIVYRVVGKGTREMAGFPRGASVNVMGPLGNGWSLPESKEICLLIGGGCGVAPLWGLAEKLNRNNCDIFALTGFQSKDKVFGEDVLREAGADVMVTTDDGSYGKKGFVVDHLNDLLDKNIDRVYICGPTLMARSVIPRVNAKNIKGEISLEENMGCGFGVCLSCVTGVKRDGHSLKERICTEGPVFSIQEVEW